MFKQLKAWYLQTFLPYEDTAHPMYQAPEEETDEAWDLTDEDVWMDAPYQFTYTTTTPKQQ